MQYGERYLTIGGAARLVERDLKLRRRVSLAFPDMNPLKAFYFYAEYTLMIAILLRAAKGSVVTIEGYLP